MHASLLDTVRSTTNRVYETVRAVSRETPLLTSAALDEVAGCQLFVKAESLQYTGSFKLRGAFYRLKQLQPGQCHDSDVVLGHSSLGTELLQQLQAIGEHQPLDTLLVPAGGGGLAAGIALALRAHGSTTRLIAVEPAGYDDLVLQRTLSGALNVTDEEVRFAMRAAVESLKLVLEPSGASALAAALAANSRGFNLGRRVGVICSGGNIAAEDFASLLSEARH